MTSNSAHNLFIDLAASGGILLLVSYILILGLVLISIKKKFRDAEKVSLEYKALVTLWVAFNIQTLISINVPALAVWGWSLSGLVLGFRFEGGQLENYYRNRKVAGPRRFGPSSAVCVSTCVVLVMPLFVRDINLENALTKNKIPEISRALFEFPRDADQLAEVAIAYEKSGLSKEALHLAKRAVSENPNSARAWRIIYESTVSNPNEKKQAEVTLKFLDPFYFHVPSSQ
jgi:hypothetical protein